MNRLRLSPQPPTEQPTPEVLVIGGTGSSWLSYPGYAPLVEGVRSSQGIPGHQRFFPLPNMGLGRADETYEELEEQLIPTLSELDIPPVIVAHSQAVRHVLELALNKNKISALVSLAGVMTGIPERSLSGIALRYGPARALPFSKDYLAGSDTMEKLRKSMATDWPVGTAIHHVEPSYDQIVPLGSQNDLQLPNIADLHLWRDAPAGRLTRFILDRLVSTPDNVRELRNKNPLPSEHLTLPLSTGVLKLVELVQAEAAQHDTNPRAA